jgi:hypothetical protein
MIENFNPNMTTAELKQKVAAGAKFVQFEYTVSIVVATFKRPTSIYFIDVNESTAKHSWHLSTLTAVMGWWGFPWGPIYTIGTFITNFGGGKDVTAIVMQQLLANERLSATQNSQTATSAYGVNNTTSGSGNNTSSQNTESSGASQYNIPR